MPQSSVIETDIPPSPLHLTGDAQQQSQTNNDTFHMLSGGGGGRRKNRRPHCPSWTPWAGWWRMGLTTSTSIPQDPIRTRRQRTTRTPTSPGRGLSYETASRAAESTPTCFPLSPGTRAPLERTWWPSTARRDSTKTVGPQSPAPCRRLQPRGSSST